MLKYFDEAQIYQSYHCRKKRYKCNFLELVEWCKAHFWGD